MPPKPITSAIRAKLRQRSFTLERRKVRHLTHPSGFPAQSLYCLQAPVKDYAWGSKTLLAQLTGAPPAKTPQAEMWFGTHPTTPTLLTDGRALADIADLPYLVKLLAAEQPLSIQAHPGKDHARIGFEAENAAGIAMDHPQRTYKDANHKPEMLIALSDFTAMAGFRDPADSSTTFRHLAELVDDVQLSTLLESIAEQLADGKIQEVFGRLVDPDGPFWDVDGFTRAIFAAVADSGTTDAYLRNAGAAAAIHPDDPGALVALLMHLVQLAPGEALYVPSGTIHAYVSGLGLEVMATSDNVIRGGLTVKHIDVAELEKVVSYTPTHPPIIHPSVRIIDDVEVTRFTPPVKDFALTRYDLPPNTSLTITAETPHIAVGTSGTGTLTAGHETVEVTPGAAIFVPGHGNSLDITADQTGVTLFIASQP